MVTACGDVRRVARTLNASAGGLRGSAVLIPRCAPDSEVPILAARECTLGALSDPRSLAMRHEGVFGSRLAYAAASSPISESQHVRKSRRCSARGMCAPPRRRTRKYCRSSCRRRLAELCGQAGRTAEIVDSHRGADVIVTAKLLAEAPQALAERDLQTLRVLGVESRRCRSRRGMHRSAAPGATRPADPNAAVLVRGRRAVHHIGRCC